MPTKFKEQLSYHPIYTQSRQIQRWKTYRRH